MLGAREGGEHRGLQLGGAIGRPVALGTSGEQPAVEMRCGEGVQTPGGRGQVGGPVFQMRPHRMAVDVSGHGLWVVPGQRLDTVAMVGVPVDI